MLGILGGLGLVGLVPTAWGWKVSLLIASTPVLIPLLLVSAIGRLFPGTPAAERFEVPAAGERVPERRGDPGVVAQMFVAGIVFALSW